MQIGTYSGDSFEFAFWDFELSSFDPIGSGKPVPNIGNQGTASIGVGAYCLFGASASVGFNYSYFSNQLGELW